MKAFEAKRLKNLRMKYDDNVDSTSIESGFRRSEIKGWLRNGQLKILAKDLKWMQSLQMTPLSPHSLSLFSIFSFTQDSWSFKFMTAQYWIWELDRLRIESGRETVEWVWEREREKEEERERDAEWERGKDALISSKFTFFSRASPGLNPRFALPVWAELANTMIININVNHCTDAIKRTWVTQQVYSVCCFYWTAPWVKCCKSYGMIKFRIHTRIYVFIKLYERVLWRAINEVSVLSTLIFPIILNCTPFYIIYTRYRVLRAEKAPTTFVVAFSKSKWLFRTMNWILYVYTCIFTKI